MNNISCQQLTGKLENIQELSSVYDQAYSANENKKIIIKSLQEIKHIVNNLGDKLQIKFCGYEISINSYQSLVDLVNREILVWAIQHNLFAFIENDNKIVGLTFWKHCHFLETLSSLPLVRDLSFRNAEITQETIESASKYKNLENLNFISCPETRILDWSPLQKLSNLKKITIGLTAGHLSRNSMETLNTLIEKGVEVVYG